jgi:hypothetical protein
MTMTVPKTVQYERPTNILERRKDFRAERPSIMIDGAASIFLVVSQIPGIKQRKIPIKTISEFIVTALISGFHFFFTSLAAARTLIGRSGIASICATIQVVAPTTIALKNICTKKFVIARQATIHPAISGSITSARPRN